jgi:ribosomal protein L11 methyltransferase
MQYLAYHFIVTPSQPGSEILMAMIADQGFDSFDYSETGFTAYIKEEDAENVHLNDLVFEDFQFSYSVEKIKPANWNAEWEKNFEPVRIDDVLLIRAPFHEADKSVKLEIVIMPKMSFGTGHHQTTQLMCEAMFAPGIQMHRVLDMGCGTGVLAILAKKLGADHVLAVDIDEWSVENSIENCAANNCADIVVKKGDIDIIREEKFFDLVLANINKNILKAHMKSYSEKLEVKGNLLISGFFKTDVEELTDAAKNAGLTYHSMKCKDEWAMVRFTKSQ